MPRGKTPSLIGGGAGKSEFVIAGRKRPCKRCKGSIEKGSTCIEVKKPGTMGHKTYCMDCYRGILSQSQKDLNKLAKKAGVTL